jgi:hypothetical protein
MNTETRILFHAPGLAAFRPTARLPHLLGVQPSAVDCIADLLPSHRLTGNRGNIIHAEAPAKIFSKSAQGSAYGNIAVLQSALGDNYAELMARHYDLIIISMANFIRPDHDGASLVAALKGLKERVPFIVLGCGLQGSHSLFDMMPGNRDLISYFDKHALVFGVRGEKTANWLDQSGFHNATVLGCPSLYAYPHSVLRIDGHAAREKGIHADVMTAGHLSIHKDRIVPRGLALAKAFQKIRASYVFQDEFFAYTNLPKMRGLYEEGSSLLQAGPINRWLSDKAGRNINFERYYYFNESGAWRQASLRHDVFIGDRFHGGVAALQAGQPSIFLSHDNRVSELTGHFGLPNLTTEEFEKRGMANTLDELLSVERLDAMKETYRKRYREFFETMSKFGLRPTTTVEGLTPESRKDEGRKAPLVLSSHSSDQGSEPPVRIIQQGRYILRLIRPKEARELVVTFEAADTTINRQDLQRRGFGEEFLVRNGYAVLSVLTSSANWFRPPALLDAFSRSEVRGFIDEFDHRHSYGSSMGGFGALAFADLLRISNVVALQPISSLAAELVPWESRFEHGRSLDWTGGYRDASEGITQVRSIYALFDPASADARHVDRLAKVSGDRLRMIPVVGASHAVPRFLLERGTLGKAILACLRGEPAGAVEDIVMERTVSPPV